MKFAVHFDLKGFCKKHKKLLLICIGVLLVAGAGIGGIRYYYVQKSPEKALQNITLALQKGNRVALATLVDFRSLSEHFSQQVISTYRAEKMPPLPELADNLQQKVLDTLGAKADDSVKGAKQPLFAPLSPFPTDTLAQIATTLKLEKVDGNYALARAKVDYPRAEKSFALVFKMDKSGSEGWRITKIANAAELIQAFMASETSIERQKAAALAEKNAEQRKRMSDQFVLHSCTAVAGLLSDNQTALLSVEIMGRNPGPHAIFNFNVEVSLVGKKRPAQSSVFLLNLAKRTLQGEDFAHTWNITLDLQNPEHQYLLQEKNLQCTIQFNNMGLGSGEMLFVRKNLQ